jgi:hypothetical protein
MHIFQKFSLYLLGSMTLRQFTRVISPVMTFGRALLSFWLSLARSSACLDRWPHLPLFRVSSLPKANRLPDLSLAKTAFIHVVNYFAIFHAEAVVFFTQSQFVVKPD